MSNFVFVLLSFSCSVYCFNFDTKNVKTIVLNSLNDSYFGYSILLQRGPEPRVIVGAPKATVQNGGEVFSCTIDGKCLQYADLVVSNNFTFAGNMMGAVIGGSEIVGEELIACAYKKVTKRIANNLLKGYCLYKRDSSILNNYDSILEPLLTESETSLFPDNTAYYNYAFAEAGFDIHFMKDRRRVLMGAPGTASWSGGFVIQSLTDPNVHISIPSRRYPTSSETQGYLGYSITTASRRTNLNVAGAPRAKLLFGMVQFYNGDVNAGSLTGDEIGSYFGSTLLALDVDNDGSDEIFVGAPLGAGSTFDEGYVYYYGNNLKNPLKLDGSKKKSARFGTTIASLGDIDLDSFNDVAISAPYEDGVGAVYIYLGSKNGIQVPYAQRLSPLDFHANTVNPIPMGFGLGISKGNDVDGNGHNDIAIGAYKTDQVFVFKGLSIIDYKLSLRTDKESVANDSLTVTYCITYSQRSPTQDLKFVEFKTNLQLDYRVIGQRDYEEIWKVSLVESQCKSIDIQTKQSVADLTPFKLSFTVHVESNVVGKGKNTIEKSIPYVHGCGSDNICQTAIGLSTFTYTPDVLLGTEQELVVNVIAENKGETGYQCQMYLDISPELEPVEKNLCRTENKTYICSFASELTTVKEGIFKFDVNKYMKPDNGPLEANFEIRCLGVNLESGKSSIYFNINITNSPYIVGKPETENLFIDSENVQDKNIVHIYTVGNFGPSPVKLDVTLLMPISEIDGSDLFDFVYAEGNVNGIQLPCYNTNNSTVEKGTFNIQSILREPSNKTVVLSCLQENIECIQIFCPGDYYLFRSNEVAIYKLEIKVKTNALLKRYRNEFNENLLAYATSAHIYNSTTRIDGYAATLMYYSGDKSIALWIYIVALVLGLVLLLLLILLLYKCHFFDRTYRDKMNDERLMDQPLEIESSDTEKKNGNSDDPEDG